MMSPERDDSAVILHNLCRIMQTLPSRRQVLRKTGSSTGCSFPVIQQNYVRTEHCAWVLALGRQEESVKRRSPMLSCSCSFIWNQKPSKKASRNTITSTSSIRSLFRLRIACHILLPIWIHTHRPTNTTRTTLYYKRPRALHQHTTAKGPAPNSGHHSPSPLRKQCFCLRSRPSQLELQTILESASHFRASRASLDSLG
jgi:hypothetical protein